jgi:transposase-like protein
MKCKRSSDGRKLDHHTLQTMRQQAAEAVREGATPADLAKAYGVSERTIYAWRFCRVD